MPKTADSFNERVRRVVRGIPEGQTLTYGEVASRAGNPKAARAVGSLMARNSDKEIPCHRVVRSDGSVGGYNGIRGGAKGAAAKRALIAAESSPLGPMEAIGKELQDLITSPLYRFRVENGYVPVVGEGNTDARIMFVGEAPGESEAKTGKPFCGASGRVLDQLLASIGMSRADVYITNLVKDRPPENRDPSPEEISLYAPFLDRQIAMLRPRVIAALGRHSMRYLFERFGLAESLEPISKIHGKAFAAEAPYGFMMIIALYHPAVALYNGSMRKELLKDFKALKSHAHRVTGKGSEKAID